VLILNEFAVCAETAVVVEVKRVGIPYLGQVGEKRARGSKCLKEEMDALVWLFGGGADEHGAEEPHS